MIINFEHNTHENGNKFSICRDCIYSDAIKMLMFDTYLGDFIKDEDEMLTFQSDFEYEGNIIILFKQLDKEPVPLFCFDGYKGLSFSVFYSELLNSMKQNFCDQFI